MKKLGPAAIGARVRLIHYRESSFRTELNRSNVPAIQENIDLPVDIYGTSSTIWLVATVRPVGN